MKRLIAGAAGTLALMVALTIGLAVAHTAKYGSTVTARYASGDTFEGKVRSQKAACERRRKVKVLRKRVGADELVGSDRTNSDGEWRVPAGFAPFPPPLDGVFYAKATKKVVKHNARHRHTCKPAKSDEISFTVPPGP